MSNVNRGVLVSELHWIKFTDTGKWSFYHYCDGVDRVWEHDEDCFEVVSELDLPSGSDAWIVWVVWSSGDSFGWATNRHVEVLAIFDHEWYANAFAEYVRNEDYESNNSFLGGTDNPFDFKSEDGQEFKYDYIPWDGYFESLEAVHVDKMQIV